jgi:ATP adenylyltransferase/5',5'''-P-1,P-4-tetraphosphate phosphorylase II
MNNNKDIQDKTNFNSPLEPVRRLTEVRGLFNQQVSNWELARANFAGLQTVQTKSFSFGDFEVKVQFNPARIVSSGAKVDAKTIAGRKCFLCADNRPVEQKCLEFGDYEILVNPFPIFPEHFTIPRKEHVDQQILPYFTDMLELAKAMDDYLVFYNGPRCGASAPDHMHFQAGTKDFLPLVNDYKRLKETHAELLVESSTFQLNKFNNYLRTVYCIESINIESAKDSFEKLYSYFLMTSPSTLSQREGIEEPMLNIVCTFENDKWFTFVLPRKTFRPWQYTADGEQQLMISPATVEMCGIFITPIQSHFERITAKDIESILEQVSL